MYKPRRRPGPMQDDNDPTFGSLRNKVGINLSDAEERALRFLTEREATYVPGSRRRMGQGGIARILMLESPRFRQVLGLPPIDSDEAPGLTPFDDEK